MTDKPAALAFQPAPRPTPRVSADMAAQLAGANADLGFTRASSPPAADAPVAPKLEAPAFQPTPRAPAKPAAPAAGSASRRAAPRPMRPAKASTEETGPAVLKLAVPEALWKSLRIEAINRRVTVKYLVLEALAKQGHLDLEEFHEDGRRLR
jgi:hypothetical protein